MRDPAMIKIFAVGKKFGEVVRLAFIMDDDGSVTVFENDEPSKRAADELFKQMARQHPVDGSYVPKKYGAANALNVIRYYFFDDIPVVELEGEITDEEVPDVDGIP